MELVLPLIIILILFALFLWVIDTPRRNEERQFGKVKRWLNEKGYQLPPRIGPIDKWFVGIFNYHQLSSN